ncbi:uncharacterized protein [Apostichopus japonicus]|uniref:uncharacterized protein n=1 Tax=Stichopus japonicus TaxID=307972 RepID=UPI003AB3186E
MASNVPNSCQDEDNAIKELTNDMKCKLSVDTPSNDRDRHPQTESGDDKFTDPAKLKNVSLYDLCTTFMKCTEPFTIHGWFSGIQKIELKWQCSRCGHTECSCFGEDSFFTTQSFESHGDIQVKARFNFDDATGVGVVWCYSKEILSALLKMSSKDWRDLTRAVLKAGGYFVKDNMLLPRRPGDNIVTSHPMTYLQTFTVYCSHPCLHRQLLLHCTLMHGISSTKDSSDWTPRPILKCIAVQT